MQQIQCPNCKHLNLAHAVFCYECGQNLGETKLLPGIKPQYQNLLMKQHDSETHGTPRSVETVNEMRKSRETGALYDAKLTCLRCGTINKSQAQFCENCGASLLVSDEINQLRILASARSSVGRVRNNNEDTVGLWARSGVVLGLVADGMGGAAAGEEASRLSKEAVQADFMGALRGSENLQELSESEAGFKLRMAIDHANSTLLNRIRQDNSLQGMGTTSTLAMIRGNRLLIAHVGDSRAYLVDGEHGWIHQITDDHSFVEALLAAGHITQSQAARHPMRSVLYRALGQSEALGGADLYVRDVKAGDRIILCSDGLPRHVANDEIAEIALKFSDPEMISQGLIDLTLSRGAEDNVSVVAMVVITDDEAATLEELKAISGEQERAPGGNEEDAFRTGQIDDNALDEARAIALKMQENLQKGGNSDGV